MNRRIINGLFRIKARLWSSFRRHRLDYGSKPLRILVDNLLEYETRRNSCRKEPETIAWIEKHASQGAILYDIGANIGAYSLVAAANGCDVFAFEPSYPNYHKLNLNVSENGLDDRIRCIPLALSSQTKVAEFKYFATEPGTSRCYYNEDDRYHLKGLPLKAKKAVLVFTLDDFVETFGIPLPTMIKIDVDGAEFDVVKGAPRVLESAELRTLLIEIDDSVQSSAAILDDLRKFGFKLESKHLRVDTTYNYILVKQR